MHDVMHARKRRCCLRVTGAAPVTALVAIILTFTISTAPARTRSSCDALYHELHMFQQASARQVVRDKVTRFRATDRVAQRNRRARSVYTLLAQMSTASATTDASHTSLSPARTALTHTLRIFRRDVEEAAKHQHELEILQASSRALTSKIGKLRRTLTTCRKRTAAGKSGLSNGSSAKRKIHLVVPVSGITRVSASSPGMSKADKRRAGKRFSVARAGVTLHLRAPSAAPNSVRAAAAGRVILSRKMAGYGSIIAIRHAGGYVTLYGFLSARDVHVGDHVRSRAKIGASGLDPISKKSALYLEIRKGRRPLNPRKYFKL